MIFYTAATVHLAVTRVFMDQVQNGEHVKTTENGVGVMISTVQVQSK